MRLFYALTLAAMALAVPAAADGRSVALMAAAGNKYLVEDPDRSPVGSFGFAPEYRRTFHDRFAWVARAAFLHTAWNSPDYYRKDGVKVDGSGFTGSIQDYEAWGRLELAWNTGRFGILSGLALGLTLERMDVKWIDATPTLVAPAGKYLAVYLGASAAPIILRWEARPGLAVRLQPEIGVNEFHGLGTLRSGGEDAFLLLWMGLEYGL